MLGAITSYATSANLATIGNELAKCRNVFVVDGWNVFTAKTADLLLEFLNWWLSQCGAPSEPGVIRNGCWNDTGMN